ncbi:hypothetical protein OIO90_001970 [Microbotryomycetes sp. JL221]|nr:hypothetical protein OIO90_001970 [Microbotryomycetes sp. JL221]
MPEFNIYAVSHLIGWQSTALSFFLLLPSLCFGWRDKINYFDPSINTVWLFAEAFSLAGLLLVPEPLPTQIVLVAWYCAADILLFIEATFICGWFRITIARFQTSRHRQYWETFVIKRPHLKEWRKNKDRNDKLAQLLLRENDENEREYAGARWRRDVEWQILALTLGLLLGPCIWYPLFFLPGMASKEYAWDKSNVSNFKGNELVGWILGIISSIVYVLARVQAHYKVRNMAKWLLNKIKGYREGDTKFHHWLSKPDQEEYVVCATGILVYTAFILDNVCQLVSIMIICKGQDFQTRVLPYLKFQFDVWTICTYFAIMSRDKSGAKRHGKWFYPWSQFPKKIHRHELDKAFEQWRQSYQSLTEIDELVKLQKKEPRAHQYRRHRNYNRWENKHGEHYRGMLHEQQQRNEQRNEQDAKLLKQGFSPIRESVFNDGSIGFDARDFSRSSRPSSRQAVGHVGQGSDSNTASSRTALSEAHRFGVPKKSRNSRKYQHLRDLSSDSDGTVVDDGIAFHAWSLQSCKRFFGGPFGTTTKTPLDALRFTKGETKKHHRAKDSHRYMNWGTFDDCEKINPKGEFFCGERSSWMREIPGLFHKDKINR